jgi:hypothetical protein
MPSEHIQRQIDAKLDALDVALSASDWETVHRLSEDVLRLDPANEDASACRGSARAGFATPASPQDEPSLSPAGRDA